jgi:hypothetical protein
MLERADMAMAQWHCHRQAAGRRTSEQPGQMKVVASVYSRIHAELKLGAARVAHSPQQPVEHALSARLELPTELADWDLEAEGP